MSIPAVKRIMTKHSQYNFLLVTLYVSFVLKQNPQAKNVKQPIQHDESCSASMTAYVYNMDCISDHAVYIIVTGALHATIAHKNLNVTISSVVKSQSIFHTNGSICYKNYYRCSSRSIDPLQFTGNKN